MRRFLAATATAALLLALGACGSNDTPGTDVVGTTASGSAATATAEAQPGEHNDADVMFARMMIPHHAQAVEMSEMLLAKDGMDERVRGLAEQIKAAQAPEIEQLSDWLEAWGEQVPSTEMPMGGMDGDGMPMDTTSMPMAPGEGMGMPMGTTSMPMGTGGMGMNMGGMMSAQDMQALSDAQGVEAARLFLTQMIAHHEGAITMARSEVEDGQNTDAKELAQTIVDTQQREIDEMRGLLEQL